jgi:WD40 repeat protein
MPANERDPNADLAPPPADVHGDTVSTPGLPTGSPSTLLQASAVARQAVRQLTPAPSPHLPTVPGYTVSREIARGGMAVVYEAHDPALERVVAIKVMHAGQDAGRFVVESKVTAQLPHPGIPPVYALGTLADGRPFLAMKLIRGRTLTEELEAVGRSDLPRLLNAFERICQTVGFAHARGIIHRDLKPSNVMVGTFGEVLVMDWGLAKSVDPGSIECTQIIVAPQDELNQTIAGQVKGTPAYMAPEQARGEAVDARTDVFALGGILAVILTGKPPFLGNTVFDTVLRAAQAELGECFQLLDASGVDGELVALAKRCLAGPPKDRPESGAAVAEAMAAFRAGVDERLRRAERERAAAEARADSERATAAERRKRLRTQWALAGAVLLLLAAGGVGAALASLWRTAEQAKESAEGAKDEAVRVRGDAERAKDEAVRAKGDAERARDQLAGEKKETEAARDDALKQKEIAEQAKTREAEALRSVERERAKLAVLEYGRTVQVAHQEWREHNAASTVALLAGTQPEFRGWEYRYVNRLCHLDLLTVQHTDRVHSAAFSPDGTRIVTGSADKTAKVWDEAGKVLTTLKGHSSDVNSVAFSPNGTRVVTASWDHTAMVWDLKTGKDPVTLTGHKDFVNSAAFGPDGEWVVTASSDHFAKIWDANTGRDRVTLKGHTSRVLSAAFSPDGARVVTASADKTARVWDVVTGKEVFPPLKGHTGTVSSASYSRDGKQIVTSSWDNTGRVWDAKTGKELLTLEGHTAYVSAATFSPDGTRIVTGSWDHTAKVWDVATGRERLTLTGHTRQVLSVAFNADGMRVITAGWDNMAKVWEVPSARLEGFATNSTDRLTLTGHVGDVWAAPGRVDAVRVVTITADHTAKVWDAATGKELNTLTGHAGVVSSASFSPDGTRIVTTSADKTARVWNAATGKEVCILAGHTDSVTAASFSPDGTQIVTGSADTTARVWNAKTGTELHTLQQGPLNKVDSVAFSPDGSRILVGGSRNMQLWNAKTGKQQLATQGHPGRVTAAAFSPDGARVVTGGANRIVRVWDLASGKELVALRGHTGEVWSAAFSPDGTRIVTGSTDQTTKVWDAATGAELITLRGYMTGSAVAFSPDGSRVVTGVPNTTLVWDGRPEN